MRRMLGLLAVSLFVSLTVAAIAFAVARSERFNSTIETGEVAP